VHENSFRSLLFISRKMINLKMLEDVKLPDLFRMEYDLLIVGMIKSAPSKPSQVLTVSFEQEQGGCQRHRKLNCCLDYNNRVKAAYEKVYENPKPSFHFHSQLLKNFLF